MSEPTEYLTVDDDLSWQREAAVGSLAEPEDILEGNRQGVAIDPEDDDDNGEDGP